MQQDGRFGYQKLMDDEVYRLSQTRRLQNAQQPKDVGLPGCSKSDVSNQWPAVSFQKRHQKTPGITEDAKLSPACMCAMPCATIELKLSNLLMSLCRPFMEFPASMIY